MKEIYIIIYVYVILCLSLRSAASALQVSVGGFGPLGFRGAAPRQRRGRASADDTRQRRRRTTNYSVSSRCLTTPRASGPIAVTNGF